MLTWQEARERVLSAVRRDAPASDERWVESVEVRKAVGRTLARPVYARRSSPHYPAAAMDGYAVQSRATFRASETNPVKLLLGRDAVPVDTGDVMPPGFDAVVMVEDAHVHGGLEGGRGGPAEIEIAQAVSPWQHVRLVGEDVVELEMLYPSGHVLRPVDVGALLQAGIGAVEVRRRPVVAILPTGDELRDPESRVGPGEIPEFNSSVLAAMVEEWGGVPMGLKDIAASAGDEANRELVAVPDEPDLLARWVKQAAGVADVVVVNAGSSRGSGDLTFRVLDELGTVLAHGIATRPAKPVILAMVDEKPVIGLPGYPVSAYLAAELFLKPLVFGLMGLVPPSRPLVEAKLTRRVVSSPGVEEFVRVKLGVVRGQVVATPLARGAGVVTSLARADGILVVPLMSEGIEEGATVKIQALRPPEELNWAITIIGSHDPGIDVLGDLVARMPKQRFFPAGKRFYVSSAHVGSLAGMMAVRRGEALAAGVHLLDETTGSYNVPHVRRLVTDGVSVKRAALVRVAVRKQGLMVARGNPKDIRGFADLTRSDVVFVNRQRGAGTRVLLDYWLKRMNVNPGKIRGYDRQEYTHAAVAVAVASGSADVGLGIMAAARAFDLDFVPVADEPYELLIPDWAYDDERVQVLLSVIRSDEFKAALEALGGYDCSTTGEETWVEP